MDITTRFLTRDDSQALATLYGSIAQVHGGFIRSVDEITKEYIDKALMRAQSGGIGICAIERASQKMIGAITARKIGIKVFDHVLTNVIVGVHPEHQSRGIGRRLFLDLLEQVQTHRPEILRVELIARESNPRQIAFYEAIGFRREGTLERRIRNPDGEFEADIPMAWLRPEDMVF